MQVHKKNVYVVLGMARSGTSTITRALKALGIDLGDKLTPAHEEYNPKGFWEDDEIVYQINGQLCKALNFACYGIELMNPALQLSQATQLVRQAAVELLSHRFKNIGNWGFKDPSTVKLLTFWQNIFKELAIEDHYVIALRNPLSSAYLFRKAPLIGIEVEKALLVWLMHLIPAIDGTMGKNRVVVSYEEMLIDPILQLTRMRKQLSIQLEYSQENIDFYTNNFIDSSLQHHSFTREDLSQHPASAVVPLCLKTYDLLVKLSRDEIFFDSKEFLIAWQEIKFELNTNYPMFLLVDKLLKNKWVLDNSLSRIKRTWFWKASRPFRKIYNILANIRRKKLAKRRIVKAYG